MKLEYQGSVQKAITVTVPAPPARPFPTQAGPQQAAQDQTTPRLANGKPDLTGNWNAGGFKIKYDVTSPIPRCPTRAISPQYMPRSVKSLFPAKRPRADQD